MLEAYHNLRPKPKSITGLKQALHGDLGRPSTETNRQGYQKLFKTIEKNA